MSLVSYPIFYQRYGIRKLGQLTTPPLPKLEVLCLPRESIYHYPGVGPLDDGPGSDANVFNLNNKIIYMRNITTLGDLSKVKGTPRNVVVNVDNLSRRYRNKNPRFKPSKDLAASTRDASTLLVYNYAYIHRCYKYMRSYLTAYWKWNNLTASVWQHIAEAATQSNRQNFIEVTLPQVLPSVSNLRMAEQVINQQTLKVFNSAESLMLLEIWKWLGENRAESLISAVKPEHYHKVNLIFRESGRWTVINLGKLDAFRKSDKTEMHEFAEAKKTLVDEDSLPEIHKQGLTPDQLQKRFLHFAVMLFEARTGNDIPENLGEVDDVASAALAALHPDQKNVLTSDPSSTGVGKQNSQTSQTQPSLTQVIKKVEVASAETDAESTINPEDVVEDDEEVLDTRDISNAQMVDQDIYSEEFDAQVDADLDKLENIGENVPDATSDVQGDAVAGVTIRIKDVKTLETSIIEHCNRLADNGGLSAAEYRKYIEMAGTYKTIVAPNGQTLDKFINITPDLTKIVKSPSMPDKKTVVDKTMLQSSLLEFDKKYVDEVLHRDVAAMVTHLQHAGVIVTDYSVEEVEDITGSHTIHEVKIKPLQGSASTLHFKLPKVDEDSTFRVNNVRYSLRKQRGDLPLRKIGPNRVALTSYYGKIFVERSQKRVNNYGKWLCSNIVEISFQPELSVITNLVPGNCFSPEFVLPRLYTILAQSFNRFTLKVIDQGVASFWDLSFNYKDRQKLVGSQDLKAFEVDGSVVVGVGSNGAVLVMGADNVLYKVQSAGGQLQALPSLEDILGISGLKTPVDFAELKVFGKMIPVGVVLGYLMGLDNVLKAVNVTPRIVPAGTRTQMTPDEWAIVFQDETWLLPRDNELACMVLGGWREHKETTITYNSHMFNKKDVYLNVLEDVGLGVRYMRELDLLSQMFVDPITKELLLEMGEPTDFEGLMYKSSKMLLIDQHPNELDSAFMRIKGYERFAGTVYAELVRSVRTHNGRPGKSRYPLELNPYAVWIQIQQDPAKNQCIEQNPIQNLKELEAVTYSGTGGRTSRSMTKKTRIYHRNDMGTISESTVDSSDVGINIFLSADPQFNSLRGTANRYKVGATGATALLSTSALLAVGATNDDPKRVNFIGIQNSHGVACNGYRQNPVRTGYEQVVAQRTGDMFAASAKQAGKVVSVTAEGIVVEYEDKTRHGVRLGTIYGNAAGLVIPHAVVTKMKAGQVFKVGDILAYNEGFFEPDMLNPGQVVFKTSTNAKTVLFESADTLEDSSAISNRLANRLRTKITKVRTVVVSFEQIVHRLVKPGDLVETESILCVIEDSVGAGSSSLDEETLDTLRALSAQTPQAKVQGRIDRVELYYHGEKEDMNDSLRAMAEQSDVLISRRKKAVGKKAFTGSVDENFRIDNEALALDTVAIQIYITSDVGFAIGDKAVFGNQMKTVVGRIFGEGVKTEAGEPIDAIFSAKSIDDRIVTSPIIIGTTTSLLLAIGKKAVEIYKS